MNGLAVQNPHHKCHRQYLIINYDTEIILYLCVCITTYTASPTSYIV